MTITVLKYGGTRFGIPSVMRAVPRDRPHQGVGKRSVPRSCRRWRWTDELLALAASSTRAPDREMDQLLATASCGIIAS
jgi:hypothetical protein